jgi:hypothetical protein
MKKKPGESPGEAEARGAFAEVIASSRDMKAMADMGMSGMQGAVGMMTNPGSWARGLKSGATSLSKSGFEKSVAEIMGDNMYDLVTKSGVDLPALRAGEASEMFRESAVSRFGPTKGVYRASQQSYDGAASIQRFYTAKEHINLATKFNGGKPLSDEALKIIGDGVNTMTGRGASDFAKSFGNSDVGKSFFAPSFWVSQVELASGRPVVQSLKHALKTGEAAPLKLFATKYATLAGVVGGGGLALDKALKGTDWRYDSDPLSPNYGRVVNKKTGTTVQAMPPSLANGIKMILQAGGLRQRQEPGGDIRVSPAGVGSTITNKVTPLASAAINMVYGSADKKRFGKDYSVVKDGKINWDGVANHLISLGAPISVENGVELFKSKEFTNEQKIGIAVMLLPFGRNPSIRPPAAAKLPPEVQKILNEFAPPKKGKAGLPPEVQKILKEFSGATQ